MGKTPSSSGATGTTGRTAVRGPRTGTTPPRTPIATLALAASVRAKELVFTCSAIVTAWQAGQI